jgi:hypothetical protein
MLSRLGLAARFRFLPFGAGTPTELNVMGGRVPGVSYATVSVVSMGSPESLTP